MKILLLQLDGKLPNLALMRIAAEHRDRGDTVELRQARRSVEPYLWDEFDTVYASLIFEKTRPLAERLLALHPGAIVGGTGWNLTATVEQHGIRTQDHDYSIYPAFKASIGFTQRGCRLKCKFCVVPRKEGAVREENTIWDIYRGEPYPRELILLDNDFFGQEHWRDRIREIRDGEFKVNFCQGINARMLSEEAAEAIASVDYRSGSMDYRQIYTAWDSAGDEEVLFRGLNRLIAHGVKPVHLIVYILIGFWPGETHEDRDYRRARLREFGAMPYPMPFVRTKELVGFQRWCLGGYDKRIPWAKWVEADYEPRKLGHEDTLPLFAGAT